MEVSAELRGIVVDKRSKVAVGGTSWVSAQ
jgi:hypothetical protein